MEPALIALGVTLVCAALVPLTTGRILQGAALGYLGAIAYGAGMDLPFGALGLMALAMAAVLGGVAGSVHVLRHVGRHLDRRTA